MIYFPIFSLFLQNKFRVFLHVCGALSLTACSYDGSPSLPASHHGSVSGPGPAVTSLLSATDTLARGGAPAAATVAGTAAGGAEYNGLDFRITMDTRSGPPVTITLVASTLQEKAAWCSDISQVSQYSKG